MDWNINYTLTGNPGEETITQVQHNIDQADVDGSVSADPDAGQWSISFGVTATSPGIALDEADGLLATIMTSAPTAFLGPTVVGIEATTLEELERRAELPTMPELVGASEVGELLGVSRQRVHQLHSDHRAFPVPLIQVAMGPLWDARAIDAFARGWDRTPGRRSAAVLAGTGVSSKTVLTPNQGGHATNTTSPTGRRRTKTAARTSVHPVS